MCAAIELILSRSSPLAQPDLDPVLLCSWTLALPSGDEPPLTPVHKYKQLLCIGQSLLVAFLQFIPHLEGSGIGFSMNPVASQGCIGQGRHSPVTSLFDNVFQTDCEHSLSVRTGLNKCLKLYQDILFLNLLRFWKIFQRSKWVNCRSCVVWRGMLFPPVCFS